MMPPYMHQQRIRAATWTFVFLHCLMHSVYVKLDAQLLFQACCTSSAPNLIRSIAQWKGFRYWDYGWELTHANPDTQHSSFWVWVHVMVFLCVYTKSSLVQLWSSCWVTCVIHTQARHYCHSHNHWWPQKQLSMVLISVYYWKTVEKPETDPWHYGTALRLGMSMLCIWRYSSPFQCEIENHVHSMGSDLYCMGVMIGTAGVVSALYGGWFAL